MTVKKYFNKKTGNEVKAIQFIICHLSQCNNFVDIQEVCIEYIKSFKLDVFIFDTCTALLNMRDTDWIIIEASTILHRTDESFRDEYTAWDKYHTIFEKDGYAPLAEHFMIKK